MSNSQKSISSPNTIIKDALILFAITLVAGFLLGVVYEITKPIIDQRAIESKKEAYQLVFADAETFVEDEELSEKAQTAPEDLLTSNDLTNITIDEVLVAQDSSKNILGHVLSVTSSDGYGGDITLSLGYSLDGTIQGIEFLVLNETVGFGQNAANPEFTGQFVGKQTTEVVAVKSGASSEDEIDGITGATVTTDAITRSVNAGMLFLNENISGND